MRATRGPALVLEGDEIDAVRDAVVMLISECHKRGAPLRPKLLEVFEALRDFGSGVGSDPVQTDAQVEPDRSRWVSTSAAADALGVSGSYLARLARSKRVVADRPDGWSWMFDPESLEEYRCAVVRKTEREPSPV